jgi:CheY-like chemotaxis protein
MRNPLSAILICADDIRDSLSRYQFSESDAAVVDDCIEAANNIALCVQHQKSIVDDILTVSKLDSNLLLITPIPVQPVAVIEHAMSMFRPEVQAKDIDFKFAPHQSLQRLNIDWVNLDPSRLLQITVNLITNAIKFTGTCPKRNISVHLGFSVDELDLQSKGFEYVPTRGALVDITKGDEWGEGELLYVWVQVKDTGCGLTPEEKQLLFQRFAQASPRTHAYYGGSGLGLFISRQLAELHGGQIGVSSEADVGSTFGFFIQARRVTPDKIPPAPSRPRSFHREIGQSVETRLGPDESQYLTIAGSITRSPQVHRVAASSQHRSSSAPAPLPSISTPAPATSDPGTEDRLHILIVEDNLVNQRVLSKQLVKNGCHIETADNGISALTYLATTSYQVPDGATLSVILMDLEMPEMDGLTCVSHIRQMEKEGKIKGHVPVIAVTANVREEQKAAARDRGMDDVVSKPFRIPELLGTIRDVLARLETERALA